MTPKLTHESNNRVCRLRSKLYSQVEQTIPQTQMNNVQRYNPTSYDTIIIYHIYGQTIQNNFTLRYKSNSKKQLIEAQGL